MNENNIYPGIRDSKILFLVLIVGLVFQQMSGGSFAAVTQPSFFQDFNGSAKRGGSIYPTNESGEPNTATAALAYPSVFGIGGGPSRSLGGPSSLLNIGGGSQKLRAKKRVFNLKPCSLCAYKASSNKDLEVHYRSHTGEKPFECSVCGYKCSIKQNARRHVLTRHKHLAPQDVDQIIIETPSIVCT